MKVDRFCTCGNSMTGNVKPDKLASQYLASWGTLHTGPGHQSCDAKTARAVRRKQDRQSTTAADASGAGKP